jgi:hypothetical protein
MSSLRTHITRSQYHTTQTALTQPPPDVYMEALSGIMYVEINTRIGKSYCASVE